MMGIPTLNMEVQIHLLLIITKIIKLDAYTVLELVHNITPMTTNK